MMLTYLVCIFFYFLCLWIFRIVFTLISIRIFKGVVSEVKESISKKGVAA